MGLVCFVCVCMWERKRQLVGGKLCVEKQNERALDAVILSQVIYSPVYCRFLGTYEAITSGCGIGIGLHLLWQHHHLRKEITGRAAGIFIYFYLMRPATLWETRSSHAEMFHWSWLMVSCIRKKGKIVDRCSMPLHVFVKPSLRLTQRIAYTLEDTATDNNKCPGGKTVIGWIPIVSIRNKNGECLQHYCRSGAPAASQRRARCLPRQHRFGAF